MANYYYGTLQLRGPQGALEKLTAQLATTEGLLFGLR